MPKREHLDEVIARVEAVLLRVRRSRSKEVTLPIRDVERLINASIWGDD